MTSKSFLNNSEKSSTISEIVKLVEPLSDSEKQQVQAMIAGMLIGKELAQQQKESA